MISLRNNRWIDLLNRISICGTLQKRNKTQTAVWQNEWYKSLWSTIDNKLLKKSIGTSEQKTRRLPPWSCQITHIFNYPIDISLYKNPQIVIGSFL